jgi:N-acetylglutamate synthase-like GNAT family acetyltransferase
MRRRGIARSLVEYCSEVARSQGLTFLHVIGNAHAEGFYIACSFELMGTAETRFGAGLLMRKTV